jgi:hypothetical protein
LASPPSTGPFTLPFSCPQFDDTIGPESRGCWPWFVRYQRCESCCCSNTRSWFPRKSSRRRRMNHHRARTMMRCSVQYITAVLTWLTRACIVRDQDSFLDYQQVPGRSKPRCQCFFGNRVFRRMARLRIGYGSCRRLVLSKKASCDRTRCFVECERCGSSW